MHGYHFWGMHMFWWILWFVFIVWIFFIPRGPYRRRKQQESPMDILKRRYASGEISKEEYEERKKVLEEKS